MKAIQRELGEDDPATIELRELREKIESADMPEEVEKEAVRELARLERIPTRLARALGDPNVPRLAHVHALEQDQRGGDRYRSGARGAQRGSLRSGEGEGADSQYLSVRKLRLDRNIGLEENVDMREPILAL